MLHIIVTCGCGFKSKQLEEGSAHAEATGHQLSVQGKIESVDADFVRGMNRAKATLLQSRVNGALWEEAERAAEYDPVMRGHLDAMRGRS